MGAAQSYTQERGMMMNTFGVCKRMYGKAFEIAFNTPKPTEKKCPEVWIDVRGGCMDVIHKPKGIIVIIKDWDNTPATEEKYTAQDEVTC